MRTPRGPIARGLAAAVARLCLVYGAVCTLLLWLTCGGDTDGCEPSVWNHLATHLFALSALVAVFVVGWRVWRQPGGMSLAVLEAAFVLVLLTVLAMVLGTVVPVERID